MEDLQQISIHYTSGAVDLIWLDEEDHAALLDFTYKYPAHERRWITYRNTPEDYVREMWLNLDNIEKIVEK